MSLKISQLGTASTLTGIELIPIVQDDETKRTTVAELISGLSASVGPQGPLINEIIEIDDFPYLYNEDKFGLDFSQPLLKTVEGHFTGLISETDGGVSEIEEGFFIQSITKTYTGLFELPSESDYYSNVPSKKDISYTIIKLYGSNNQNGPLNLINIETYLVINGVFNVTEWHKYSVNFDENFELDIHTFVYRNAFSDQKDEQNRDNQGNPVINS